MATKEVTVTAPLVVLLYDRTFLAGSFEEAWRRRWKLYLALATTWGIVAVLLISTGFHGDTTGFGVKKFTCWTYLLTQAGVIVHYLRLVFWPTGLCLDYGWPPATNGGRNRAAGNACGEPAGADGVGAREAAGVGISGACFFMILAPTSSFVPVNDAAFEHRMYLSLAAVVAGVVIGGWLVGQRLVERGTIRPLAWQATSSTAAILAGATLAILTFQRNADYHSEISIWRDTEAKAPGNARAYDCLGIALHDRGRIDEAIAQYEKSIELDPDFPEIQSNLGAALADRGQLDEAIAHFRKALEISPNLGDVHKNLGKALASRGQMDEAIVHLRKAVEIEPLVAKFHLSLANALVQQKGQVDEIVAEYQKALEIDPDYAEAHSNLGRVLTIQGQWNEAIAHFQKALEVKPNYADAHNNLAIALACCGHFDEAIDHCEKALEFQHDHQDARANLGKVQSWRAELRKTLAEKHALLDSRPTTSPC